MKRVMIAARPEEGDPHKVIGGCVTSMEQLGYDSVVSVNGADLEGCAGLIMPGGLPDVDPTRYGEALNGSLYVDAELDRQQLDVLARAVETGLPVLGICRGCQLINVFFGGSLIQDIATRKAHEYLEDRDLIHENWTVPGSWAQEAYGACVRVNTKHHQAVKRLAPCFVPDQFWFDGRVTEGERQALLTARREVWEVPEDEPFLIEGFHHQTRPIFAVQWHPEIMAAIPLAGAGDPMPVFRRFHQLLSQQKREL